LRSADAVNEELLRRLNESGALYLTHTKVRDRYALRFAIGAPQTTMEHVADAWRRIRHAAADLVPPGQST
jgi:aromatic-L-amino-acid decarboxylase